MIFTMALNNLQTLRELKSLGSLPTIKPMIYKRVTIDKSRLSDIALLNHSSSICLFAMRLLHDEIKVKDKEQSLQIALNEISTLNALLSKDDYYLMSDYTKKDTKKLYKEIGLKAKHLERW